MLLLAALAGTVGLSADGWTVGLICAVIIDTTLARGLSRDGSNHLDAADWVTLSGATVADVTIPNARSMMIRSYV